MKGKKKFPKICYAKKWQNKYVKNNEELNKKNVKKCPLHFFCKLTKRWEKSKLNEVNKQTNNG
jgi:hypothetical protein